MLSWYGVVLQIEKRNIEMTKACKEVSEAFDKDGFDTCVLKGQGNLLNYPKEIRNRRQPGDIDLWASPKSGGIVHDSWLLLIVIILFRNGLRAERKPV